MKFLQIYQDIDFLCLILVSVYYIFRLIPMRNSSSYDLREKKGP